MLWYKGWLETRWRLAVVLGVLLIIPTVRYASSTSAADSVLPPKVRQAGILNIWVAFWMMPALMLAGAGVKTQSPMYTSKGLHGSMQYTLAMPVSRARLFMIRAALGLGELAVATVVGSFGLSLVLPIFGLHPPVAAVLEYAVTVFICNTCVYGLSALLATFLDDVWQMWGTMVLMGSFLWLVRTIPLPKFVDIFHAMGDGSPLLTNTLPWATIAASVVGSTVLLFAALRIVQTREY